MHVTVLMGGWSAECEVSMVTGEEVAKAIERLGHRVSTVDVPPDVPQFLSKLDPKPDVVFNALHGPFGEDGIVQAILNTLQIPYTHSGVLASALAMNKPMAKRLFVEAGIECAPHKIVSKREFFKEEVMSRPFVIKPLADGSSVDVHIVTVDAPIPFTIEDWPYGEQVMVEQFIAGKELTVTVMGDRALTVTEISTERGFYDYDAKYAPGESVHVIPAEIGEAAIAEALRVSLLAHQTLGCRGISRADIRYDGITPYLLEINTQPGMTPTSLVPEQAEHVGISFDALVGWMLEHAEYDANLGLE